MHTGQFRVVRIHRSRFLARVVQHCGSKHHCKIVLPLLQSCRGGSSVSLCLIPLKVAGTFLPGWDRHCAVLSYANPDGLDLDWVRLDHSAAALLELSPSQAAECWPVRTARRQSSISPSTLVRWQKTITDGIEVDQNSARHLDA